ncbi:MAG: hypothetical protein WBX15_13530 [Thermoanaerobaculia bacterium]
MRAKPVRKVSNARAAREERGGPSLFFIIALILGLVLLAWAFLANRPAPAPEKKPSSSASVVFGSVAREATRTS